MLRYALEESVLSMVVSSCFVVVKSVIRSVDDIHINYATEGKHSVVLREGQGIAGRQQHLAL